MVDYKKIIKAGWQITTQEKNELFSFGFIPSLFGTIVGVLYIGYQIIAFHDWFKGGSDSHGMLFTILKPILQFLATNASWTVGLVILAFFIFLMYSFSPIICGGALIDLISKKVHGKPLKGGLLKGLESFFPLLEFAAITSPFGAMTFFTEMSMTIRNFETGMLIITIPILTTILIIGLFLTLLFIFAEQYIVLENETFFNGMKKSAKLVLTNVKYSLFLGITLVLIAARIFVNILLVLIIPLVIIGIIALMASIALKSLGIILGIIIGISMLIMGAYLMAGFHIFTYAVWTISFIYFRREEDKNR